MPRSLPALSLFAILLGPWAVSAQDAEPPNVLLIMIDDLGWMDVGYREGSPYDTPRIDRLAKQGMRFPNAYASQTVCSPTRAALLTGKSPARLHLTAHIPGRASGEHKKPEGKPLPARSVMQLPLDEVTLAERLRDAGYTTGFFGKWHLAGEAWVAGGAEPKFYPEHQGFDLNLGGWAAGMPRSYFSPYKNPRLEDGPEGEYLTRRLAEEVARFIGEEADSPFFACYWPYTVHIPIQPPSEKLVEKYRGKEGVKNAGYAAMVEAMDTAVGRVLDALREHDVEEETLVVFTSDNGGFSRVTDNSPLRGGKGHLYEGGLRVPLVVRWPGRVPADTVERTPVVTHDLYATLLDLTGVGVEDAEKRDSHSMAPLLTGEGRFGREAVYFHYPNYSNMGNRLASAVRVGDHKLIEFLNEGTVELYDLTEDPGEQRDLSERRPEKAAALRRRLHAWRDRVGALMPRHRNGS